MRTTLTLDDDVARLIDDVVHRERRSMKEVINEALRRGLSTSTESRPFDPPVSSSSLRAGIDPAHLNRLAEDHDFDSAL